MNVKTDTKEKFHVIRVEEPLLTAVMTDELASHLHPYLQNDVPGSIRNLVLDMAGVERMDPDAAGKLVELQQQFYENGASFVICSLQKPVEDFLDEQELLELMNVTPTESEAWDIVQMEEMEREMFGDEEGPDAAQ